MSFDDTLALVTEAMRENGATKDLIDKTIRDLRKAHDEEKADRAATTKQKRKTQHVILVSDPEGRLKGMELVGWVATIEESASPVVAYDRIVQAAGAFNRSKRGAKHPVTTLGEAAEALTAKWLKSTNPEEKTKICTKHPVGILAYPNVLPNADVKQANAE